MQRSGVKTRLWFAPVALLAVANIVLFGSIAFGLDVPGARLIHAFADDAHLDYGLGAMKGFTRLTDAFLSRVLGGVIGGGPEAPADRTAGPVAASAGSSQVSSSRPPTSVTHPYTNDTAERAYPIQSVPFRGRTETRGPLAHPSDHADCAPTGVTAWYRYTAPARQPLFADTFGSDYTTVIAVFSGSNPTTLERTACSAASPTGNAQLGFTAEKGTTYYVQVSGPAGGGSLVFELTRLGRTNRESISSTGAESNDVSGVPRTSADGRYVAFVSRATDLAGASPVGCVNAGTHCEEVFVRDTVAGTTTIESVSTSGAVANDSANEPAISADGRFVAFTSAATNLADDVAGPQFQIYVRDRLRHVTERVSVSSSGAPGDSSSVEASISADGRYVEFTSNASNFLPGGGVPCGAVCPSGQPFPAQLQIYVRDRQLGTTTLASVGRSGDPPNAHASDGSISANGRFVAFNSEATNIVPGVSGPQVYERDLATGNVVVVSQSSRGVPGNKSSFYRMSVSSDGRFVGFISDSTNLVPGDTNGATDIFVRDTVANTTRRVSVTSSGGQVDNGKAITTCTQNCVESQITFAVSLSADGRYVAFNSLASDLVVNDTNGVADVFVHDLVTGATIRVSVASDGSEGKGPSTAPWISGDGRIIAFESTAPNFVGNDANSVDDVFTHENELTL